MADTKEIAVNVDLEELDKQLRARREEAALSGSYVRSTVFSLGSDPRVSTKRQVATPDFTLVEILKDNQQNCFLNLKWSIAREDVDSGGILGFNVYRRTLEDEEQVSFKGVPQLTSVTYDKLTKKSKKYGKYSSDKKAIYKIKKGIIPQSILNPSNENIKSFEESRSFLTDLNEDSPSYTEGQFQRFIAKRKFKKIAYIDYNRFIEDSKKKFLFVKNRDYVDINHEDKSVGLGETVEYYISAVTKDGGLEVSSDTIKVTVLGDEYVSKPTSVVAKQGGENQLYISVLLDSPDKLDRVYIFRRSEDEVFFDHLIDTEITSEKVRILDESVSYGKKYFYRIFVRSIYGYFSDPYEFSTFISVQNSTPSSRSNSLKIPVITAIQDQNSDFIKLTVYPNDPNVSYYEITRRDLTIKEKKFSVPSKDFTNYGGTGWETNTFFVSKNREIISTSNPFKTRASYEEIVFLDNLVENGHIYQYRVRGYDVFGNGSSYAFSMTKAEGKKSIRSPINLKSEVLRGNPFRMKLSWNDDNLSSLNTAEELMSGSSTIERKENKVVYLIERRKNGEVFYKTFPYTANKFIIDEVSTPDAVTFEGKNIDDNNVPLSNSLLIEENTRLKDETRRAFGMPDFLKENDIYYYRMTTISSTGARSNPTSEFKLSTLADISNPINIRASVLNTKVRPLCVGIFWEIDDLKATPDNWIIERKFDNENDSFAFIGKAYLEPEFFDRNVEVGNTYVYRVKSVDVLGRESAFFEVRLTI